MKTRLHIFVLDGCVAEKLFTTNNPAESSAPYIKRYYFIQKLVASLDLHSDV